MKFELEIHHRNVPDEELIDDLVSVAHKLGKNTVTIDEYNECGKFHSTTLTRRFRSWFIALEKAGLRKTRNLGISNEELFENLIETWTLLGRQPKYNDLTSDCSKYSSGTYEKRFGSWRKALEQFVLWASEGEPIQAQDRALKTKKRTPRNINWRLRAKVLMRDCARCRLCGATPQDDARLHVDHVDPWDNGGETVLDNLQILCERCNIGKSNLKQV